MTEQEAKTKWCPFARFKFASTSDGPACNREGGPSIGEDTGGTNPWLLSGTRCIGSACMAWRWDKRCVEHIRQATRPAGEGWAEAPTSMNLGEFPEERAWQKDMPATGFCGLAGKP